ncbi:hypothetical protein LCM00_10615 [Bacillus infantis]|uniref:hypothetical protein n=1 Tax=Bacillus infantis TaxID=324767 RepID=UPI001CD554CF|nr:hypothetical protein [Bacillus infantis]MCA1039953.1 hypothetical protein [Bacillus infantis]
MGLKKVLIAASSFLFLLTGCSTPSYYTYEGKSENWDGKMEIKADETISEAAITLKLMYNGEKIQEEKELTLSVSLPGHSKAAYQTDFSSKEEASVEHVFEHVKFPADMEESFTVLIQLDDKQEKLILTMK